MELLKKDEFLEFATLFKTLPWSLRKEILDCYEGGSEVDKMRALHMELVSGIISADDWSTLYKSLEPLDQLSSLESSE